MANQDRFLSVLDDLTRSFVGFDQIRSHFRAVDSQLRSSFPPTNVYREYNRGTDGSPLVQNSDGPVADGDYVFEFALSGYTPDDVEVKLEKTQGVNLLTVKSTGAKSKRDDVQWLHNGIAARSFSLSYTVADFVEVKSAAMKNGLLTIRLGIVHHDESVKIIPVSGE